MDAQVSKLFQKRTNFKKLQNNYVKIIITILQNGLINVLLEPCFVEDMFLTPFGF